ncbi:lichenicidin A2 family type 2 lantibiotic [Actinomyces qiguomingii]|uniref:lichenicidin A2 family type 2 lantibiotic n=1 Tax=Actinomyces qiguomingii TaxID=2057800 RepID=UPI000CA06AD2|nr:lichenicidin A2 family type 2 lantibiotic [Actinomyces qiguomingii]
MTQDYNCGPSFESLSQEEMDFVTGANGDIQPAATPTLSSVVCGGVSKFVGSAIVSFVGSFVASASSRCRD